VTLLDYPASEPLPGYKKILPMVYAGIYPTDNKDFENLRVALEKYSLNDASLVYEPETSVALGSGFRCGFLGLLHMDVVQQRLEDEFGLDLISTAPSVVYRITKKTGEVVLLENPSEYPDPNDIAKEEEPYCKVEIMTPSEYMGPVMNLCQARRGNFVSSDFIDEKRLQIIYEMPLSEIIFSFFNKLKSITAGYASLDYEVNGYKESDLCRMDILLNGDVIDALTMVVWRGDAVARGRAICAKLKEVIPRQQFEIPVQAAIGGKIIAREDIKPVRKDVLAKCYGGDISRKKKLLEAQKRGKKRMKQFGKVSVPQEAFIAVLTVDGRDQ
jgi:GTP-binding protein LepA